MVAPGTALPPLPVAIPELLDGLWAGRLDADPLHLRGRRGRVRRWAYAAAADAVGDAVGAAVVDLGYVGTAFVWAVLGGEVVTWERLRPLATGIRVGRLPADGGRWAGRDRVAIDGRGGLVLDVRPAGTDRRLRARLQVVDDVTPAVLVTDTVGGGWNVTSKTAGYGVAGELGWSGGERAFAGGGWRDWTVGRQDRSTVWRWAAGAGVTADGRRVGINASTGMNQAGAGEDVVWWDGVPHPLHVTTLAPVDGDPAGPWTVAGPGWRLLLEPAGVRAASEQLLLVSSRYVQPVGRFHGTLPGPDGAPVEVALGGVTEDHEARW